jgi:transcriptional regulator with XRE-family HTH domain
MIAGMATKSQQRPQYQRLKVFLKRMRKEAGLTQEELARKLKVPQSFVYKSETAIRRIDITEFVDWSVACGKSPVAALKSFLQK